jgi:predicted transcriptional regulator
MIYMAYSDEIKKIRQKCFLSQESFARELGVSFSSINRWEGGKSKPNVSAMKKIKGFCDTQGIDFSALEEMWIDSGREDK